MRIYVWPMNFLFLNQEFFDVKLHSASLTSYRISDNNEFMISADAEGLLYCSQI